MLLQLKYFGLSNVREIDGISQTIVITQLFLNFVLALWVLALWLSSRKNAQGMKEWFWGYCGIFITFVLYAGQKGTGVPLFLITFAANLSVFLGVELFIMGTQKLFLIPKRTSSFVPLLVLFIGTQLLFSFVHNSAILRSATLSIIFVLQFTQLFMLLRPFPRSLAITLFRIASGTMIATHVLKATVSLVLFQESAHTFRELPQTVLYLILTNQTGIILFTIALFVTIHARETEKVSQQNRELNTYRDQLEHALKLQTSILGEKERGAAVGFLAAGVAHDIRNPLNNVVTNLSAIQMGSTLLWDAVAPKIDQLDLASSQQKQLHEFYSSMDHRMRGLIANCTRIDTLINNLISFGRPQHVLQKTTVDLNEVIRSSLYLTDSQLKRLNQPASITYSELPLLIEGDFYTLEQVAINAILNACKAVVENSGKLSISVGSEQAYAFFQIRDTGCGISELVLEKVGQPYFTAGNSTDTTGLGLYISKHIVEEHQGIFLIESQEHCGTTITVKIPL